MRRFMKFGQIIRLPDGREATIVYHGLEGYGVAYGRHYFFAEGQMVIPIENIPAAEAMLRKPELEKLLGVPCVGEEFEFVSDDPPHPDTERSRDHGR